MKLVPQLMLATVSLTLGWATLDIKSVSAAIVNYNFTVDSSISKGKGIFSFDDSTFSNDNIPTAMVKSLSFQFDGESTIYTELDDVNYPNFPLVTKFPSGLGQPSIGLDYLFEVQSSPSSFTTYEIVGRDITISASTDENTEIAFGSVSYSKIPEPTTLGATLFACGFSWFANRKKKVKA